MTIWSVVSLPFLVAGFFFVMVGIAAALNLTMRPITAGDEVTVPGVCLFSAGNAALGAGLLWVAKWCFS